MRTLPAVVLVAAILLTAACGSGQRPMGLPPHACGMLGVGIGWRVSASSTCRSAMAVLRTYFHGTRRNASVMGYACKVQVGGGDNIRCERGLAMVYAVPNH
jgi:hypothetical protein